MSFIVESDFTHAGLRCVTLLLSMGHRCGYVSISTEHPLHKVEYSQAIPGVSRADLEDVPIGKRGIIPVFCCDGETISAELYFDVHGSVTYSGGNKEYPVANTGLWWFGFDCGHSGDVKDIDAVREHFGVKAAQTARRFSMDCGSVRSLKYVQDECRSLAEQLVKFASAAAKGG